MTVTPAEFMAAAPRAMDGNNEWASRYARELRGVITRAAVLAPRSQQASLGPSELGVTCDRQVVGKLAGTRKTNNVSDPWPSIVGTAVHAWLAAAFSDENRRENLLRWAAETTVTPHPDYPGHADLYDALEQAVVDWKVLGASSLAKVRSPAGPSRKYRVQLILYGIGFRALGLPVKRVVLAALPRTASVLDGMYVWDHELTADDEAMAAAVIGQTGVRKLIAAEVSAGRMSLMQVPASPDDDECFWCLSGATEVVTRQGIKPIAELAGTSPELLVPMLSASGWKMRTGTFQHAPVRYLGEQPTYRVVLEDRRARKVITATAEHAWIVTDRTRVRSGARVTRHQWRKVTSDLQPGDLLQPLRRAVTSEPDRMDVAVAQGFVFGDGTRGQSRDRPATLAIYAASGKHVMLPFFPGTPVKAYDGVRHLYGLPRSWKELPPVSESRAFLLSWLAGYFAADGHVTRKGQCTLSSAQEESLLFVRDLAAVCGIGYRPVTKKARMGINATQLTDLFEVTLRRRDLPSWFFLIDAHHARAEAADDKADRDTYWKVVSVEPTGHTEPVYCATVEKAEAFGLADDIMTGNCPFYRPQASFDNLGGCPGTITRSR